MQKNESGWVASAPFAHRGLHDSNLPENSMPAFEAAAEAGYGIELDIHLTLDRQLAVIHDDDTVRMTGKDITVTKATAADLKDLRLENTSYGIPMLGEVLDVINGRVPILVEIKTGSDPSTIGPAVVDVLSGYKGMVAVQSFDPRIVLWLKKNAPNIVRGQLAGSFAKESMPAAQKIVLRNMLLNVLTRPNFIAFDIESMPSLAVKTWTRLLHSPLLLWTVKSPEQQQDAQKFRANTIFEGFQPASGRG